MTVMTMEKRSSSHAEAERQQRSCWWVWKRNRRRFEAIQLLWQPETLTEEVQREQGERAENKEEEGVLLKREYGGESGDLLRKV